MVKNKYLILRSVIPVVYIRTTVLQWSRNSSQKTRLYLYVQWLTNYMFRQFPNWPSSGWNTMSEELYTYCKYSQHK